MRELHDILEAYRAYGAGAEPLMLATVLRVEGSTYRRPGARMLLGPGGRLAGAISGGCLEADLQRRASWMLREDSAGLLQYDSREDDEVSWSFGLGCRGLIDVLVEKLPLGTTEHVLGFLDGCQKRRATALLATVADQGPLLGRRLMLDTSGEMQHDLLIPSLMERVLAEARAMLASAEPRPTSGDRQVEGFNVVFEVLPPRVPLVIFGAGFDVVPVVDFAARLGFHTTVVATRPSSDLARRFAAADAVYSTPAAALEAGWGSQALVLLMTHNFSEDVRLLPGLLASPARYVGLLGPSARRDRLLEALRGRAIRFSAEQQRRLYGPVGLDLGAEGPEEIAVSILAELTAFLARRPALHLRDRPTPLHPVPRSDEGLSVASAFRLD